MKTILVPTQNTPTMQSTLETAVLLAQRTGAYIEGVPRRSACLERPRAEIFLLFRHPPSEQHHSRPERRYNYRRHYPAAEREKHRDVIANQRASRTHQCACDDAAG
jgi:hypothetical protein